MPKQSIAASSHKAAMLITLLKMEMTAWYTKEFLTTALCTYLRRSGYAAQVKESTYEEKAVPVVLASKWGSRRIIEIKGYSIRGKGEQRREQLQQAFGDTACAWFHSTLFHSVISLARSYRDAHLPVALCLPDIERYQEILTGVEAYFTANNLHLEIFLIREDCAVRTLNLNQAANAFTEKRQQAVSEQ